MTRADRELLALIKIVDSTKTMVCMHNGSVYQAISAEAGTKHGLNPAVVTNDELAQARTRDLDAEQSPRTHHTKMAVDATLVNTDPGFWLE